MFTHQAADRGKGVVLSDQTDGVVVPLLSHQGDVPGDVHVGGT